MIAVDTNILVRYFAEDDPDQTNLAQQLLEERLTSAEPGFVSLVTLVELIWVLNDTYKIARAVQSEIVQQLLAAPNIVVESDELVRAALKMRGGDISDHVIHLVGLSRGCSKTVTFDKKFARIDGVERLV
jgi:predicted nucleic-acid-binding protein